MAGKPPPLPRGWTKIVRSAVIHADSVASTAMTTAWSNPSPSHRAADSHWCDRQEAHTGPEAPLHEAKGGVSWSSLRQLP